MRQSIRLVLMAGFLSILGFSFARAQGSKQTHQTQIKQILADSNSVNYLLDQIIASQSLRNQLLNKLATTAYKDRSFRLALEKKLAEKTRRYAVMQSQQILIKFKANALSGQIQTMESAIGLKKVKEIPQLKINVYQVPRSKSLDEVIRYCQKQPFVQYAEKDQTYRTQDVK